MYKPKRKPDSVPTSQAIKPANAHTSTPNVSNRPRNQRLLRLGGVDCVSDDVGTLFGVSWVSWTAVSDILTFLYDLTAAQDSAALDGIDFSDDPISGQVV